MGFWEGFGQYVGIGGVISIILTGIYGYGVISGVTLPDGYTELMSAIVGFFIAKNGTNIAARVMGNK